MSSSKENFYIMPLSGARKVTESICKHLGVEPVPTFFNHFADGEIMIKPEIPVRNKIVTVVQSISKPVNERLMELLIAIDSLRRASAKEINVLILYYAYARQDRKTNGREPITSKLIARMLEAAGATRVTIVDVHSEQTQGFFEIPVDTIAANKILTLKVLENVGIDNLVIVSPDYGGVKRARKVATWLNVPMAILDKRRPRPNEAEISNILGEVENKDCFITDDMIDTAGTMIAACEVLKKHKAKSIIISATHGLLSDPASERLTKAYNDGVISKVYVSNSIETVYDKKIPNLEIIDLGEYLAKIIRVYYQSGSISEIYEGFRIKKTN